MKKIVVFGGDGVGMIVASIVKLDPQAEMLGFLNDVIPTGTMVGDYEKYPVLGTSKDAEKFLQQEDTYFVYAYSAMQKGAYAYEKMKEQGIPRERLYSAIHPTSVIPTGFCDIGRGVIIAPLAQVGVDVKMEDHAMLFPSSYVGHNTVMSEFSHLAANSVVGSYCHLGKGVHIGMNAVVREKVHIGDYSLVGAGSVVLHDVPENCIVVGNPARILRRIEPYQPSF